MKLIPDWKKVLRRAWSIKLLVLAGVLSGIEVALPFLDGYLPIPPRLFATLAGLTTAAALVARILAQKEISND